MRKISFAQIIFFKKCPAEIKLQVVSLQLDLPQVDSLKFQHQKNQKSSAAGASEPTRPASQEPCEGPCQSLLHYNWPSVAKSRGSSVEGSKSRVEGKVEVEGKSRGSRVKVEGQYFSPFFYFF